MQGEQNSMINDILNALFLGLLAIIPILIIYEIGYHKGYFDGVDACTEIIDKYIDGLGKLTDERKE